MTKQDVTLQVGLNIAELRSMDTRRELRNWAALHGITDMEGFKKSLLCIDIVYNKLKRK